MDEQRQQNESTAEQAGIVDQQDAALEKMQENEAAEKGPEVGPMADDPMEGEAPSG